MYLIYSIHCFNYSKRFPSIIVLILTIRHIYNIIINACLIVLKLSFFIFDNFSLYCLLLYFPNASRIFNGVLSSN